MREDERVDELPDDDVEGQAFKSSPPAEEPVRRPRDDARGIGPRKLDETDDDVAGHVARPPVRPIEASP
jgi:hypothetical protein